MALRPSEINANPLSEKPLKLLNFSKYFPPVSGGIEAHAQVLADLQSEQYDVTVLAHSLASHTTTETRGNYRVVRSGTQFKISTQPISLGMIWFMLRNHFDLIHIQTPNVWGIMLAGLLKKRAKLVVTHQADIHGRGLFGSLIGTGYRYVVRRSDALVVMSMQNYKTSMDLKGIDKPVSVVSHAVDPEDFPASADALAQAQALRQKYAGSRTTLVFAGRLVPYKGLDVLVRAAAKLGDVCVLVIGDGPERQNLEAQAKALGVASKFVFLGSVAEADKNAILRAGDIFVFPSTTVAETFGIAQVEAQLCGLPIVTSALPTGVTDVTRDGETGLCTEPGNSDQLADAINRLVADKALREKLGQAGYARAQANYVPDAVRRKLFAVYDGVLGRPT